MNTRLLQNITKIFAGSALTAAALSAAAQTYYRGNPNIIVPKSGFSAPGYAHTHCLIRVVKNNLYDEIQHSLRYPSFGPQGEGGNNAYTPTDIHTAYGIPTGLGTGAIAIVDAFNLSTVLADFNAFATKYGLPTEPSTVPTASTNNVFQVVYASGTAPANDDTGWGVEIALDIEWVHAMAPAAKIYLVEGNTNAFTDLFTAVTVASSLPNVKEVSMSWGSGEFSGETALDANFQTPGIVYFASAGDVGGAQEYPSESPFVVGVGGTTLHTTALSYGYETAWIGSGGGPSSVEPRPDFQAPIERIVGTQRGTPDVSAVADPSPGAWVYSTGAFGTSNPWAPIGGTSLACPVTAAITNDRGTWTHSTHREEERIYFNLGGPYYRDITAGSAGSFEAAVGWDFITGIGTPKGLFPTYIPAENLTPKMCGVYQDGKGNIPNSNQSGILAAVKSVDNVLYTVNSVETSLGQTSDIVVNFTMDHPLSVLSSASVNLNCMAPVGTTYQIYAYNYTSKEYVYSGISAPATGAYSNLAFPMSNPYIQSGTGDVSLIVRTIRPPHISTLPYTFDINQVYLAEVTVPPWDVNEPL